MTIRPVYIVLALAAIASSVMAAARPARALPVYSRRYNVPCETCHTVAPRLNAFGRAFQANFFNWPGGSAPSSVSGPLAKLPVSAMATFSEVRDLTHKNTSTFDFRVLDLFASHGFTLGGKSASPGGYFVDYVAAIKDARAGDLRNAFVSVPVGGKRGQYAMTAGQFTPMTYQYDPINSLTQSLPAALADDTNAFSFLSPTPGLRAEFFDNRGKETDEGDYVSIGVPFEGHFALNKDSDLSGNTHGLFVQAFRRDGMSSVGAFGFEHSGNNRAGLLATHDVSPTISLLAAGSLGHDALGNRRALSLEGNYFPMPTLGLTGRLETSSGDGDATGTYPVAAITYYPLRLKILRITGETVQQKGRRTLSAFVFLQL